MHYYSKENAPNNVFYFSINAMELSRFHWFQPIGFYPKIYSNAHFNIAFPNIGWFDRKIKSTVEFFIIQIRISKTFMHLWSKLAPEIFQKIGGVYGKTGKPSQCVYFTTFFSKKLLYLLKNRKHNSILYCKYKCVYNIFAFTIKNALVNIP